MDEHSQQPSTSLRGIEEEVSDVHPSNPFSQDKTKTVNVILTQRVVVIPKEIQDVMEQTFEDSVRLHDSGSVKVELPLKLTLHQVTDYTVKVNQKIKELFGEIMGKLVVIVDHSMQDIKAKAIVEIKIHINKKRSGITGGHDRTADKLSVKEEISAAVNRIHKVMNATKHLLSVSVAVLLRRVTTAVFYYLRGIKKNVKTCIEDRKSISATAFGQIKHLLSLGHYNFKDNSQEKSTACPSLNQTKARVESMSAEMEDGVKTCLEQINETMKINKDQVENIQKSTYCMMKAMLGTVLKTCDATSNKVMEEIYLCITDVQNRLELEKHLTPKHLEILMTCSLKYVIATVDRGKAHIRCISASLVEQVETTLETSVNHIDSSIQNTLRNLEKAVKASKKQMEATIALVESRVKTTKDTRKHAAAAGPTGDDAEHQLSSLGTTLKSTLEQSVDIDLERHAMEWENVRTAAEPILDIRAILLTKLL